MSDYDDLDGAGGLDTLNARLDDDVDNVSLTDIEVLNFRAEEDATVDADDFSGVDEIWSDRSKGDLQINNLAEDVILGMDNVAAGGSLIANYDADAAPDVQGVVIEDSGSATSAVDLDIDNPASEMEIESKGDASFLTLGTNIEADLEDLTLTGAADLTLDAGTATDAFQSLEELDASEMTGDLTFIGGEDLLATDITLTGGDGDNDSLILNNSGTADLSGLDFPMCQDSCRLGEPPRSSA